MLCLPPKEAPQMASVRCTEVPARPSACLAWTGLTREELHQFSPPCETAFHAPLAVGRLDGQPRLTRRFTGYHPWPLPPPAERLCCMLVSLKTSALPVGHGRVGGLGQSQANPWRHVLLPMLLAARRPLGAAPARALSAWAPRLGGSAADAAPVVAPREQAAATAGGAPVALPASPLGPMPGRHGASPAPKPLRHRRTVRAASKKPTRCNRCGSCLPSSCSAGSVPPSVAVGRSCVVRRPRPPRSRPGVGGGRRWAACRARCR